MMSDEEYMNLYGESWYEIRDRDKRIADLEEKLYWAQGQWDRCLKRIAELSKAWGVMKTIEETMVEIIEREMAMSHVELHKVRLRFFEGMWDYSNKDLTFRHLVKSQLELYCGTPDPRDLYRACNSPKHLIRNRMLSWDIDHPTSSEQPPADVARKEGRVDA